MIALARLDARRTSARIALSSPAREAIVTWNASVLAGDIALAVDRVDGRRSSWLPYVSLGVGERRSCGGRDDVAAIDVDRLHSEVPIAAIDVRAQSALDAVWVSVPGARSPAAGRRPIAELGVGERSQYPAQRPDERGWCSAASIAMLLDFHGVARDVAEVAANVYDAAYGGTGNWTLGLAYASTFGVRAIVAHLDGLDRAGAFLRAGIPLAVSIAWDEGELAGAPIPVSAGHLLVVRGIDPAGNPIVNDPAHDPVRTTYARDEFERAWLAHGGVAYIVSAPERECELIALANGA